MVVERCYKKEIDNIHSKCVVTTTFDIAAAALACGSPIHLLASSRFFSQDPLEKFFSQARQRCCGNFYIDVNDVIAAAKVERLLQLLKYNVNP